MTFGQQGGVIEFWSYKLELALLLWRCSSGSLLVAHHSSYFLLLYTILGVVIDGRRARHVVIVVDLRVARLCTYMVLHLHAEMMALWLITVRTTAVRVLHPLEVYAVQGTRTTLLQQLFRRVNM